MQQTLAIIIGLGLLFLLWRQWRAAERKLQEKPVQLFSQVKNLLSDCNVEHGEAIGTWKLTGDYQGRQFQLKAIVDTLATRKLPSLWLLVTMPEPQNVSATLNLMMRPTGPTSFSNFDFLRHTLKTPRGFPLHAVIRTDDLDRCLPAETLRPYLALFETRSGKEFLISPKGLRIVVQVAEVDRLRYGVLREANFGDTVIDPEIVKQCLDTLLALETSLKKNA
jgi:hypothetical protein